MIYWRKVFKFGIKIFVIFCFCILLFILAIRVGVFGKLPNVDEYKKTNVNIASEIYSADSILIGKYYTNNRTDITYNEISPWLIKALLSYSKKHNISKSIAFMVYINAHRSTYINRFVLPLKIIFTERMINNRYSEAEKNTVFLNNFDFTYNAYGIASASRIYFNKKAKDLDINEAATFVAMLDNPSFHILILKIIL